MNISRVFLNYVNIDDEDRSNFEVLKFLYIMRNNYLVRCFSELLNYREDPRLKFY